MDYPTDPLFPPSPAEAALDRFFRRFLFVAVGLFLLQAAFL